MFKTKQIFIKARKNDNKHEISAVKLTSYKPDIKAIMLDKE